MILRGRTLNNIELWESHCSDPAAPIPVQAFLRIRDRDWYMIDEVTGNMLSVLHKATVDLFEYGRYEVGSPLKQPIPLVKET